MSNAILDIYLGNVLVGRIARVSDTSTFSFDSQYLLRENRPILGRIFEENLTPSAKWVGRRNQLPEFFRHYLPEEDTRLRALVAQEHGIKESNELALLLALGRDLPGAIVARGLEGTSFEDSPPEDVVLDHDGLPRIRLRFSLAGVQLKLSMIEHDQKLVLGGDEAGVAWIVKLYGERYEGTAENEYSMMTLAREVGITVPACRLVAGGDLRGLPPRLVPTSFRGIAVARYDRTGDRRRIHQEDFAQVFDVPATSEAKYSRQLPKGRKKLSYEAIARALATLCGRDDVLEFVRRLAFCIVIGNEDAHLKNWSLTYPDGVRARLSPAYDLVSTVVYEDLDRGLALPLFGEFRMDAIELWHFEQLAQKTGVEHELMTDVVREMLDKLRSAWDRLKKELPLLDAHRRLLDGRIATNRWK